MTFNTLHDETSPALRASVFQDLVLEVGYRALPVGNLQMAFPDAGYQELRPALDGKVFHGAPAIGFAALNYVNANVTPGVLSNYSGVYPHRSSVSCTNSTNPQNACP